MKYIRTVLSVVRNASPILFWIAMINFMICLISLGAMLVDDRILMGVSVWLKPFKFGLSTGIYILTVGYLVTLYHLYCKMADKVIYEIYSRSRQKTQA